MIYHFSAKWLNMQAFKNSIITEIYYLRSKEPKSNYLGYKTRQQGNSQQGNNQQAKKSNKITINKPARQQADKSNKSKIELLTE
jgi:hypothetical protein